MKPIVLVLMLCAMGATPALANADKASQIVQQQREIRDESESSTGAYARFDRRALERMHAAQDRIFVLLDGVASVDQLGTNEKVELFNAVEEVKAIIAENESDRQKCWRERKVGTTIPQTRCATVAELEQIRSGAQDWKGEPGLCSSRGDGCTNPSGR
jgi:hypothetical protein